MAARSATVLMLLVAGLVLVGSAAVGASQRIETKTDSLSIEVPAGWSAIPEEQAIRLRAVDGRVDMFVMHGFLPYDPDGFIARIRSTPGNRVVRIDSVQVSGRDGKEMVWTNRTGARGGSGTVVDVLLPSNRPERSNVWIRLTLPRGLGDERRRRYEADLRSLLESLRIER